MTIVQAPETSTMDKLAAPVERAVQQPVDTVTEIPPVLAPSLERVPADRNARTALLHQFRTPERGSR